jgi:tetratricopeptide repeat protein
MKLKRTWLSPPFSAAKVNGAESNANFEKAATLDPKNTNILNNLASSYIAQRNFEAAGKILDRAIVAPSVSLSVPILKLDPSWDRLREDPRFQALIEKHSGKI